MERPTHKNANKLQLFSFGFLQKWSFHCERSWNVTRKNHIRIYLSNFIAGTVVVMTLENGICYTKFVTSPEWCFYLEKHSHMDLSSEYRINCMFGVHNLKHVIVFNLSEIKMRFLLLFRSLLLNWIFATELVRPNVRLDGKTDAMNK